MPTTSSRKKEGDEQPRVPCELPWSDLTKDERNHAKKLNFERTTWGDKPQEGEENGHEEDWTKVPWTWAKLEGKEKQAAEALGFTEESWKGGLVNVTDAASTPEPQQKSATPIALDSVRRRLFAKPTPEDDEPIIVPEEPAKAVDTDAPHGGKNKADKVYGVILAVVTTASGFGQLTVDVKEAIQGSAEAQVALEFSRSIVASEGDGCSTWSKLKAALAYALATPVDALAALVAILEDKEKVKQLEELAGKTRIKGATVKEDKVYGALLAIATTESGFDKLPKAAKDAITASPAATHALAQLCASVSTAGAKAPKTWAELKEVGGPRRLDFGTEPVEVS